MRCAAIGDDAKKKRPRQGEVSSYGHVWEIIVGNWSREIYAPTIKVDERINKLRNSGSFETYIMKTLIVGKMF